MKERIMKKEANLVHEEYILKKIFIIRGVKVMLDTDLAELYEVENKALKRVFRRHKDRSP